ncbi:MAG: cysteine dioxygenase family protein [Candidatus Binatus sp.]|uniref:cysteine dioxygenase n=1 Tax=Candidatus Binatus sp. TaxID=2811406 RepID=UPI0027201CFC|nr:cysteine dioxygenase family protein [Candidatus Binatus sp.]MDO8431188.1 cysteine dioxygenase family protein [Candidatus Binatus sp.]
MFDLKQFIENCKGKPASAVKDLIQGALRDPAAVSAAIDAEFAGRDLSKAGIADLIFFRSPTLTVLKAATPPKFKTPPHNHNMWAVIGTYDGQEDNTFYRRGERGLEKAGGKDLKTGDVVVLGEDAIHAIANPLDRPSCAIHIYGGDLLNFSNRSVWNPFTFEEHPYDIKLITNYARELMAGAQS